MAAPFDFDGAGVGVVFGGVVGSFGEAVLMLDENVGDLVEVEELVEVAELVVRLM